MSNCPEASASPLEREDAGRIRDAFSTLNQDTRWDIILDLVPNLCLILNDKRQVVFSNSEALSRLGLGKDEALGARPGELFGCIHATEAPGGCGMSRACGVCGATGAVLAALGGGRSERECRIVARKDGGLEGLDLRVTAVPIRSGAGTFVLVTFEDISDEKRRQVLERLFFHDIMNSLASIQAAVSLINDEFGPEVSSHAFYTHLRAATDNLIDEVRQQREILTMESGDLTASPEEVDPERLVREVVGQAALSAWGQGRNLELASRGWTGSLTADPVLLRRVVGNMLKNALEASEEDGTVEVDLAPAPGGLLLSVHNSQAMDEEVQLQVFQRSFSTKGRGRGLGTWSMKLLAEDYLGGKVDFVSREGEGTTFRLWLPGS